MARFATGVTVVTTVFENKFYGLTVNAFCSVSLDPALVLVSLDNRSRTLAVLRKSRIYSVNILTSKQEDLSRRFAGKDAQLLKDFADIPLHVGETGVPLFDEALAAIECQVVAEYAGGDHTLFMGQVVSLRYQCQQESSDDDLQPLLFFCSHYSKLAQDAILCNHVDISEQGVIRIGTARDFGSGDY